MILINFFVMIILTSLTGSVIFIFWTLMSIGLERCGEIKLISSLLRVVLLFHLIPVVFMWLVCATGAFSAGKAGSLLAATPLLIETSRGLAYIWLAGFLMEVVRYIRQEHVRRVERRISIPAGAVSREQVRKLRERLHISQEIPVYELETCRSPFITGFFKSRIFIPKVIENEEEMEVILEHELYHHVRGDLHLKKCCAWIVRLQWFNPFVHLLVRQVDSWGDSLCDYHICYGSDGRWDMKKYFDVVIKYTEKKKRFLFSYDRMHMGKSRREILKRMKRMQKLKTDTGIKKGLRRASVTVLAVCFVLASAVTSLAAGKGMEELYGCAYEASMARIREAADSDLEEYTRERDEDMEIVETDEEVNLDSRGLNTYTWDLDAGVIYGTGLFWATKGDEIAVTVNPSPAQSYIGMGLDQPDGYLRGVSGKGPLSHTFTVTKSGLHRVYAENLEKTSISVGVVVSR